ncbi:MAG: hypothetical protein LBN25_03115, partial [Christensenellaceae bacterium]|nr:hypothetical protein [Christensenellaceae bacterium]
MKRKFLLTLSAVALILSFLLTFAACKKKNDDGDENLPTVWADVLYDLQYNDGDLKIAVDDVVYNVKGGGDYTKSRLYDENGVDANFTVAEHKITPIRFNVAEESYTVSISDPDDDGAAEIDLRLFSGSHKSGTNSEIGAGAKYTVLEYNISSLKDLNNIKKLQNSPRIYSYKLTGDIDFAGQSADLGIFKGVLTGVKNNVNIGGYTLKNGVINKTGNNAGLAQINNGTITKINFENFSVTATGDHVGVVA